MYVSKVGLERSEVRHPYSVPLGKYVSKVGLERSEVRHPYSVPLGSMYPRFD